MLIACKLPSLASSAHPTLFHRKMAFVNTAHPRAPSRLISRAEKSEWHTYTKYYLVSGVDWQDTPHRMELSLDTGFTAVTKLS
ncbi:hypothetical protein PCANC_06123 [Puccinia coronata f. sp. avenae]|uniref:Uncharacterized protein n=1 Tax=Puccinia coronata f. sp. avenae TaxID=200324 RepID=A0A2N5VTV4_9BASI|nr:hypothetical protein PCANC_10888 [Puccinia coronata f. sp. avenae]PLW27950.1 hypothetical protein PCASD_20995 [Puccinia coronata f. sp. avenae]PLW38351.1 hypothetical protein PCASD_10553 [Puccinia coronata f. sp. avenae]PLW53424.1 hypothetical protein PCANC_06123 [Puccinia coronata f. sp. avenae]